MSKDFIGFRVTPDVKERLEAEAEKEMRPLSHLIRDRVVRPLEVKEERTKALARTRKAVENDPSNLNATLDEKGSLIKDESPAAGREKLEQLVESSPSSEGMKLAEKRAWIKQETTRLKARMQTRRAEAEAEKNWDKLNG